jgi:hypothetical protein
MSTLAAVQREFIERLYGEAPEAGGFAVYRRNLFANLGGALEATYPVVLRLVGDAFFREAVRRYVLAHPSTSGDLNDYGGDFAAFLGAYEHARELHYLPDVARLEWACHESDQAADGAALDFAALARVDAAAQAAIRFQLHPAVRVVKSAYPVACIWHANQPGRDGTPDRGEGAECVLVRRERNVVLVESIEPATWTFVEALGRGLPLAEAGEQLGESLPTALTTLAAAGVVTGFTVPSPA